MRRFIPFFIALLIFGCSKHPAQTPTTNTPPGLKELGAVELVPKKPTQFNLENGQTCILTGSQLPDCINVQVLVLTTNAQGKVARHSLGEISTLPGRPCAIGDGNIMISLTPTLKTP